MDETGRCQCFQESKKPAEDSDQTMATEAALLPGEISLQADHVTSSTTSDLLDQTIPVADRLVKSGMKGICLFGSAVIIDFLSRDEELITSYFLFSFLYSDTVM